MKPIKIGICGLGTVGYGSYCLLNKNSQEIARRVGREVHVSHIGARRVRSGLDIGQTRVSNDIFAVARDPEIDILLELIGGYDPARDLVLEAIANGKHVVTANKALIAVHGNEIFAAAREANVVVAYEASVAGGIPIVKAIREGLAGNRIQWLAGIINGTSNYILSEMTEHNRGFDEVLKEAQELGYAEVDPSFDVDGIDAAHKLTILASIAFGIPLQFDKAFTEGIGDIKPEDIRYARELGYHIKPLGITRLGPEGIELRVHPTLIDEDNLLASVNGVMNAVMVHGDAVGPTLYYGAGAGAEPTASAVVADIVDVARMKANPEYSVPALAFQQESLSNLPVLPIGEIESAWYLRIAVQDKVGVLADITEILEQSDINIEAVIQKEPRGAPGADKTVTLIILTHEVRERVMRNAIKAIESLDATIGKIASIRVDKLGQ